MNIKKYQNSFCNLSALFSLFSFFMVVFFVFCVIAAVFRPAGAVSEYRNNFLLTIASVGRGIPNSETLSLVIIALINIAFFFIFRLASKLFFDLSQGMTPFSSIQIRRLKRIAQLFLAVGIIAPFIYSFLLSLLMKNGYHIEIGISTSVIIGLVIYGVVDIFRYGEELQTLSDDTV